MLIIGNYKILLEIPEEERSSFVVYNFSSIKEGLGKRLSLLPVTSLNVYDKEFDCMYYKYIINTDIMFMSFMDMIYQLYDGYNIYIMVTDGDVYESLSESLGKIIQTRYGYNAQFVHEFNDIDFYDDSEFSSMGIQMFEQDRIRFLNLLTSHGLSTERYI